MIKLSIDMAKKFAIIKNNDIRCMVRLYFIKAEKSVREQSLANPTRKNLHSGYLKWNRIIMKHKMRLSYFIKFFTPSSNRTASLAHR